MAALTRSTARSAVKTRMGLNSAVTDGLLTDSVINQQLQFALDDIASEFDWPWLQTTATINFSSGTAATPSRYKKILDLSLNGERLNRLTLDEVLANDYTYPGWYQEGPTLKTYPSGMTQAGVTCHYYQLETELDDDADTPLLPQEHHQTWVLRACCYCASIRRDQALKAELDSEYQAGLRRMRDDVERYAGARQVRRMRNNWRA